MKYCKKCVYPIIAVNLEIDNSGICSSCKTFEKFNLLKDQDWNERKKFEKLVEEIKKIIPLIMIVLFLLVEEKIVIFKHIKLLKNMA